jgi:hypothetical protein
MDDHRVRSITQTTKRLVERLLSGEWCALPGRRPSNAIARGETDADAEDFAEQREGMCVPLLAFEREGNLEGDTTAGSGKSRNTVLPGDSASLVIERRSSTKGRTLKTSRSVVGLSSAANASLSAPKYSQQSRSTLDDTSRSVKNVTTPKHPPRPPREPRNAVPSVMHPNGTHHNGDRSRAHEATATPAISREPSPAASNTAQALLPRHAGTPRLPFERSPTHSALQKLHQTTAQGSPRRSAPVPPPKRRKPPAVPISAPASPSRMQATAIQSSGLR